MPWSEWSDTLRARRWWIAVAILAVLVVLLVVVQRSPTSATAEVSTGMLRVTHLSSVTPAVDLYLAGPDLPETLVAPGVAYRAVSPYRTERAGAYTLTSRPSGASPTSPPWAQVSVEVPAGSAQTAALVDTPGRPELRVLDDQTAPAAAGSTQVRVVQGAHDPGALDVGLTGGPPLARGLSYASATSYVTVPARTWEVGLRSATGAADGATVPLPDRGVTTLVVGRGPGGRLVVEAVPDAATAAAPAPMSPQGAPSPRGGVEAGLGGLADATVSGSLGAWLDGWFSEEPDVPAAARMPVAATLAGSDGLRPTGMQIPSVGLAALNLADLRLDYRGALQAPTDSGEIGWYTASAVPGDPGPAVFAGHVDTRRGPAVFARLDGLRAGDTIEVPRSDGEVARFSVDSVESYPKDALPTDRIYGASPTPQLRLLTCGGPFDEDTLSYRDNVVVFASVR